MDAEQGIQVLRQGYDNGVTPLIVSVSGTRIGATLLQWTAATDLVKGLWLPFEQHIWHDGDCKGFDEQMHGFVRKSFYDIWMIGHPCNIEKWRAYRDFDEVREIKPPLVRNKDMIIESNVAIFAPKEFHNVPRGSGTWATIRYAREQRQPMFIVWPDGSVQVENVG